MSLLTYQSYTKTASSVNVTYIDATKPTGLSEGDLMVAFVQIIGDSESSSSAGFTKLDSIKTSVFTNNISTFFKVATASDVSASTFKFDTSSSDRMSVFLIRISNPKSSPIGQHAISDGLTSSGYTPSQQNSLHLVFGYALGNSTNVTFSNYSFATSSPTFTEVYDTETGVSSYQNACFAYGLRLEMSATGNISITPSSTPKASAIAVIEIFTNPETVTISDTTTNTDSTLREINSTYEETIEESDETVINKSRKWNKTSKPTTTWTKINK